MYIIMLEVAKQQVCTTSCSHVVFCGVLSVLCSCVLFLCVSEVEVVIPFCSFLYISLWLVCYAQ